MRTYGKSNAQVFDDAEYFSKTTSGDKVKISPYDFINIFTTKPGFEFGNARSLISLHH